MPCHTVSCCAHVATWRHLPTARARPTSSHRELTLPPRRRRRRRATPMARFSLIQPFDRESRREFCQSDVSREDKNGTIKRSRIISILSLIHYERSGASRDIHMIRINSLVDILCAECARYYRPNYAEFV